MSDIDKGVWFKSAASGLWYENHGAAGSICMVKVDGRTFVNFEDVPDPHKQAEFLSDGRMVRNRLDIQA